MLEELQKTKGPPVDDVVVLLDPSQFPDYAGRLIEAFERQGYRTVCLYSESRLRTAGIEPALRSSAVCANYTFDRDHIAETARRLSNRYRVHAVAPQAESVVVPAAMLAEALGLNWVPSANARLFRDKYALKEKLRGAGGFRMNASARVHSTADVRDFIASSPAQRFVIKPNDGTGNSGIGFFDRVSPTREMDEFLNAAEGPMVIEEWVGGHEYCVNGQVDGRGVVVTLSVQRTVHVAANGRSNLAGAFRMVNSRTETFQSAARYARDVLTASGLRASPFHMEIKIDERGPCMIEVGARLAGAGIPYDTQLAHGGHLNLFELAAANYLGRTPPTNTHPDWDSYDRQHISTVLGVTTTPGVIRELSGVADVQRMPEFRYWVIEPRLGQRVKPTVNVGSIPWQVTLSAPSHDDLLSAEGRVRDAISWNPARPRLTRAAQEVRAHGAWAARRLAGVPELLAARPRPLPDVAQDHRR